MELIRGLHNLRPKHRGCVATIGNFDGVHLGHVRVLQHLVCQAQALNLPATVIMFEPQPREFFKSQAAPPRLTRLQEKVSLLAAQGIDRLLCLPFNRRLAAMSAEMFAHKVLVAGLGVRHLTVGDDFRFGASRSGNFALLQRLSQTENFTLASTPTCEIAGQRASSSLIRKLLAANALSEAKQLLGRDYTITDRVVKGKQLGRQLGAPTANIRLLRYAPPLQGVYAITAEAPGFKKQGVCNIGVRPSVDEARHQPVLEAHLFDCEQDLYGQTLSICFKGFLRQEQKFESLDSLRQQISADIAAAKAFFEHQIT